MDINTLLTNFKKSMQEVHGLVPLSIKRHYEPALNFISGYYTSNMPGEKIDNAFLKQALPYHLF